MKKFILSMVIASGMIFSVSAFAGCEGDAREHAMNDLVEAIRQKDMFSSGNIAFDEQNKGKYVNGAVLKNSGRGIEVYETTFAGLIINDDSEESEFMVQRCTMSLEASSCSLKDKRCKII